MTLAHALALVRQRASLPTRRRILLACGFEPLHLGTFLQARFAESMPGAADLHTGLFGDLAGTLSAAATADVDGAAVVIEWADLDPRLGLRSTGGWRIGLHEDILASARGQFARLHRALQAIGARMRVAVAPPSLPLVPLGHTTPREWGRTELALHAELAAFLARIADLPGVSVLSAAHLAVSSPPAERRDPATELRAGFPYSLRHADALAAALIAVLYPRPPMKGLITDLDDTLWAGLVGEVGADGVSWHLDDRSHPHALYQQMLHALADMGVLIGVASKNDLHVVEQALARTDLLVPAQVLFPVKAHWGRKSDSVGDILAAWNIGAESVVFVDDSPMELDEVRAAWPAITTRRFPSTPAEAVQLIEDLRELFGRREVLDEDRLRQQSLRNLADDGAVTRPADGSYVASLNGRILIQDARTSANPRLLSLVNKTNQFNLNGVRWTEAEWVRTRTTPGSVVLAVAYDDRFGPLGIISVLAGRQVGSRLDVDAWVLSCRAFSRRIEHHTLAYLFDTLDVDAIHLRVQETDRNGPFRQFLEKVAQDAADGGAVVTREAFGRAGHALPHAVLSEVAS